MNTNDLIRKSQGGEELNYEELTYLLSLPLDSADTYQVLAEANRVSKEVSGGHAEVHAQFALNLAPCPGNCIFCSFAQVNGVFTEPSQIEPKEAVAYAKQFEQDGANAVFVMTTAKYPFEKFIDMSQEIRSALKPETTLIANVGDQSLDHAKKLKDAGYAGVYHALRLREGKDSSLSTEKGRGGTVEHCKMLFRESGWEQFDGPSRYYNA